MKRNGSLNRSLLVFTLLALAVFLPLAAAAQSNASPSSTPDDGTAPPAPHPPFDSRARYIAWQYCTLFGPAEVQGYQVVCPGGTFLDFYVSDGFIPGDHWELKGKIWDPAPNTAVTTSPGPVIAYSAPGRVYTYGGPGPLNAYVECTYIHGINFFAASSFVIFVSDAAACAVTPDLIRSRINRTP